jgi:hypothetical protein
VVARRFIPGSSGFPVRWSGGIAIVELPGQGAGAVIVTSTSAMAPVKVAGAV